MFGLDPPCPRCREIVGDEASRGTNRMRYVMQIDSQNGLVSLLVIHHIQTCVSQTREKIHITAQLSSTRKKHIHSNIVAYIHGICKHVTSCNLM